MIQENKKIYQNIDIAISNFDKYNFPYQTKNYTIGHFIVWNSNGKPYQYIAKTGIILGRKEKGITNLIKILKGEI